MYNAIVFSKFAELYYDPISEHFPKKKLPTYLYALPIPTHRPRKPHICFLSLWTCLFWTFHRNRLTQYVACCVWLLPLSIVF